MLLIKKISSISFRKSIEKEVDNPEHEWLECCQHLEENILPIFRGKIRKDYSKSIEIKTIKIDEFEKETKFKFKKSPAVNEVTRIHVNTKYDIISPKKGEVQKEMIQFEGTAVQIPGVPDEKHISKVNLIIDGNTINTDDLIKIKKSKNEISNILVYEHKYKDHTHIEYEEISYEHYTERVMTTKMKLLTKGIDIFIETDKPTRFTESLFAFDPNKCKIKKGKNSIHVTYDGFLIPKQGFSFFWDYI